MIGPLAGISLFEEVWRTIKEQETETLWGRLAPVPQVLRNRISSVRSWFLDQPRRFRRTLKWLEHWY
jgi:hypothetical protein